MYSFLYIICLRYFSFCIGQELDHRLHQHIAVPGWLEWLDWLDLVRLMSFLGREHHRNQKSDCQDYTAPHPMSTNVKACWTKVVSRCLSCQLSKHYVLWQHVSNLLMYKAFWCILMSCSMISLCLRLFSHHLSRNSSSRTCYGVIPLSMRASTSPTGKFLWVSCYGLA